MLKNVKTFFKLRLLWNKIYLEYYYLEFRVRAIWSLWYVPYTFKYLWFSFSRSLCLRRLWGETIGFLSSNLMYRALFVQQRIKNFVVNCLLRWVDTVWALFFIEWQCSFPQCDNFWDSYPTQNRKKTKQILPRDPFWRIVIELVRSLIFLFLRILGPVSNGEISQAETIFTNLSFH